MDVDEMLTDEKGRSVAPHHEPTAVAETIPPPAVPAGEPGEAPAR